MITLQTQLERLRQFLLGSNSLSSRRISSGRGLDASVSDVQAGFDATGLAMDSMEGTESMRKQRKKHRDTWWVDYLLIYLLL